MQNQNNAISARDLRLAANAKLARMVNGQPSDPANKPTAARDNRVMAKPPSSMAQNFLLKAKDKASVTTIAGKSTAVSRIIDMSVPIL